MTDTKPCVCSIPSKANYHVEVIWGTDDEITDHQLYYCAEHVVEYATGYSEVMSDTGNDRNRRTWTVLESTTTHLRGEARRNKRYDDAVHATGAEGFPLCGNALIPACEPELTDDDVTCWECESIIS